MRARAGSQAPQESKSTEPDKRSPTNPATEDRASLAAERQQNPELQLTAPPEPATELRAAIDKLFTVWQSELAEAASPVSLRRDDSGIWNLFLGIEGPALGLSDRWLVISFSPAAVRQNLEFLNQTSAAPKE